MAQQRIAVLGVGSVGRVLVHQARRVGVLVVAVADSSGAIHGDLDRGFSTEELALLMQTKEEGKRFTDLPPGGGLTHVNVDDLIDALAQERPHGVVVADCSASDHTTAPLLRASRHGLPIALANKKPLSGLQASFEQLRSRPDIFRHEATVGAGLPVLSIIDRQQAAGDRISRIEGAFSGTLGYIFTGLQEGKKFSEVVRKAKELGFTEPDPRDDLGGVDVARKALILARVIGGRAELEDIEVESLFSPEMSELSVEEFMARLEDCDADMATRVERAQAKGCQLRYAATVSEHGGAIKVGVVEADAANPLSNLRGTDNMVAIHSDFYNGNPLVVQGPGAGLEVTASGLLADIVSMKRYPPPKSSV